MPRLRRSDTSAPGLRRVRRGRGFRYLAADGSAAAPQSVDPDPGAGDPAGVDEVWICPCPTGHIQAAGVDAAGRRQYLYHAAWRARRTGRSTTAWWCSRPGCRGQGAGRGDSAAGACPGTGCWRPRSG